MIINNCLDCGISLKSVKARRCKSCSKKGHKNWNTGRTWFKKGQKISESLRDILKSKIGIKNREWKGDEAGYSAIHKWVNRWYGKPKECNFCLSKRKNVYEWANISGQYKREAEDWIRLCHSCHMKFDIERKNIWQIQDRFLTR